jgi:hypothetical protein
MRRPPLWGRRLGSALRVICCSSHVFAETPASWAAASTMVFSVSGSRSGRARVGHVDELRLPRGHAHFDVAVGQLVRELRGGFAEGVHQPESQG